MVLGGMSVYVRIDGCMMGKGDVLGTAGQCRRPLWVKEAVHVVSLGITGISFSKKQGLG